MARRSKQEEPEKELNTLIVDEVISTEKGDIVMRIDAIKAEGIIRSYATALLAARGIPRDKDSINHQDDDVFDWYMRNQPYLYKKRDGTPREDGVDRIVAIVSAFYDTRRDEALTDAMMLTMTKDSVFEDFEPEPYGDDFDGEELPGIEEPPSIVRDLEFPVERRLKQIYDMAMSRPSAFYALRKTFETAAAEMKLRVQGMTGEGFRQGNSAKPENAGTLADGEE